MKQWRRPKEMPSFTKKFDTPAGEFYLTLCYDGSRLREVHGIIGNAGTFASKQIEKDCRFVSILLQSPYSIKKICQKLKQNFFDINWEYPFEYENKKYSGIEDCLFKTSVSELRTKKLYKKHMVKNEEPKIALPETPQEKT